jgi:glycosyltransferase involved in cell wall biosynthesis
VLLARGGIESYGGEVMHNAHSLGLTVKETWAKGNTLEEYLQAIGDNDKADILNIRFHCPQDLLRVIYHASDAVLANSGHEPFGLVGLETMAAGGIAFTGGTGEDYAVPFHNSIVLETADPSEISEYVLYLNEQPMTRKRIRTAARHTASRFTWEEVIKNLVLRLEYQARIQGFLTAMKRTTKSRPKTAKNQKIGPGPVLESIW